MGKERGFLEYGRQDVEYRPVEQRIKDYRAVEQPLVEDDLCRQAARCMDCGIPFCHGYGCPVHNVIPEFNDLVYRGRWREALELLLSTNCFPEFTGRICPAPCEAACVLGINDDPVSIRQIELAIIERGFADGYMTPRIPAVRHAERVAVMGSGPSGLAAADVLNRAGYPVVVYENERKPGGILRYGIPDFKLEKRIVDRRVDLMREEGVRFETGAELGRDVSFRFLKSRFAVVMLTGGAREPRDLKIPGRELDGVHFAMDFLTQQNRRGDGEAIDPAEAITATGKRVVVIGGGDTGSDCLGTSLRQGAKQVYQFEIMPKPPAGRPAHTPWPMWPATLRESSSHKEGGERRWSVATKAFVGHDGRLTGLQCFDVAWSRDAEGKMTMAEVPGSAFEIEADLVLLCMGFVGPGRNVLVEGLDLELDPRGNIKIDDEHMTSVEGVFAAGDMASGQSLVVHAIADGMRAAEGIARYLGARRG